MERQGEQDGMHASGPRGAKGWHVGGDAGWEAGRVWGRASARAQSDRRTQQLSTLALFGISTRRPHSSVFRALLLCQRSWPQLRSSCKDHCQQALAQRSLDLEDLSPSGGIWWASHSALICV